MVVFIVCAYTIMYSKAQKKVVATIARLEKVISLVCTGTMVILQNSNLGILQSIKLDPFSSLVLQIPAM